MEKLAKAGITIKKDRNNIQEKINTIITVLGIIIEI